MGPLNDCQNNIQSIYVLYDWDSLISELLIGSNTGISILLFCGVFFVSSSISVWFVFVLLSVGYLLLSFVISYKILSQNKYKTTLCYYLFVTQCRWIWFWKLKSPWRILCVVNFIYTNRSCGRANDPD